MTKARRIGWTIVAFLASGAAMAIKLPPPGPPNAPLHQAGFVDIRELRYIPEDMRYAGTDNFVGTRVDGYETARCYLLKPAAQALAKVQAALTEQHMSLLIWDCYRPERAVRHFVRWAEDLGDVRTKAAHYPNLDKRALLGDYIAPRSGHSRGATVDLTLMRCKADDPLNCTPLDMGTDFDFFDTLANTESPRATPEQHTNREALRKAMEAGGFRNYPMEWWHYTFTPEPTPDTYYDLPIR